jgi:DNA-binding SARP family transcriptional activator
VIDYTVLGPVTARDNGRELSLLPQHRLLLARLVVAGGRPVAWADLVDTLWSADDDKDPPDHALVRVASELRKKLGGGPDRPDPIPSRGDAYYLRLETEQADLLRFRAKLRAARDRPEAEAAELLREATDEWGEDAGLSGAPALGGLAGTWAANTRQSLGQEYRAARLACLYHDLRDGKSERVKIECGRLSSDPEALHCEPFIEYWMIAAYRNEDHNAALDIYKRAKTAVEKDLGAELGGRLHRLAELIRNQDPALKGPDDPLQRALSDRGRGRPSGSEPARDDGFVVHFNNAPGSRVENQIGRVDTFNNHGPAKP